MNDRTWSDEDLGADDWFDDPAYDEPGRGDPHEEDWIDYRSPRSAGRKIAIALGVILIALIAAGAAGYTWVQGQIDPGGEPGAEVELEIPNGSTTEDIGRLLADNDVITSSTVWNYWTRLNDKGPYQAGFFVFRQNSSFDDAAAVLDQGPRPPQLDRLTIPEGLTIPEIVARLASPETGVDRWEAAAIQAAIDDPEIRSRFQPADQPSMEGMLFPDTYEIDDETDERSFVRRLVTQLDENLLALEVEARAAELGVTPYQIVVVASLIEEESRVPEERAKVARVIYNRLAQGIPLGIDATSRYEAEIEGRSREDLDFTSDSPYNTRRVAGLPPTPIAGAGRASLEAALNPEPGPWIYYVLADEQGNHFFTESAQEFQRAKQECAAKGLGCG